MSTRCYRFVSNSIRSEIEENGSVHFLLLTKTKVVLRHTSGVVLGKAMSTTFGQTEKSQQLLDALPCNLCRNSGSPQDENYDCQHDKHYRQQSCHTIDCVIAILALLTAVLNMP